MTCHLVIDIGNSQVKGGLFEADHLVAAFSIQTESFSAETLKKALEEKKITEALIASVNTKPESLLTSALSEQKISWKMLDPSKLKFQLKVDEPDAVGHDRIAAAYGALKLFPLNDCIIVDIGTAITCDYVEKEGVYTGGMIYPGASLSAQALARYTDKLPLAPFGQPSAAAGKTTISQIQSGLYYGILGAVERMIDALRLEAKNPSAVKIVATGGMTRHEGFSQDLTELVDLIQPDLTLIGLHEIYTETIRR